MLLDVPAVLAGIGVAILGFAVVIAVCLVVLRLLTVVLPPGPRVAEPYDAAGPAGRPGVEEEPGTEAEGAEVERG